MPIFVLVCLALAAAPAPNAVQEKERGDRLAANGDVAGAREAYENALKLSPGYAAALNELGILSVNQDRKDEAVELFRKAVAADAGFALAHNNLGFILRKLGRFAEAVEAYKAYLALEPGDVAGVYGLAESYRGGGDKANALATYDRYLAADKDAKNQKRIDKAQASADALRKELGASASAPPAVAAAPVAAAAPVTSAAVVPAEPVVAAVPSAPAVAPAPAAAPAAAPAQAPSVTTVTPERAALALQRVQEGLKHRAEGRQRESLFALQDAANADPTNVQAVFELGVAYAMLYYFPQAIDRWQRVLQMPVDEATRASAQQNIERARQKMGAAAAGPATATATAAPQQTAPAAPAAAAPRAATPLTPQAQQAYTRGVGLYAQQSFAEALAEFDRAIQLKEDFAQAFAARGSAHFAMRSFSKALNDYAQAMRLDATIASPVFGVAEALNALGRRSDALPYYQAYAASRAPDAQPQLQELARQRVAELTR